MALVEYSSLSHHIRATFRAFNVGAGYAAFVCLRVAAVRAKASTCGAARLWATHASPTTSASALTLTLTHTHASTRTSAAAIHTIHFFTPSGDMPVLTIIIIVLQRFGPLLEQKDSRRQNSCVISVFQNA